MERFVVGAALLTAAGFAAFAMFGGGDAFEFRLRDDEVGRLAQPPAVTEALAGGGGSATTYAVTALRIEDAAAIVEILPEDRADVEVSVAGGSRVPAFETRIASGVLVLDGGLRGRIRNCESRKDGFSAVTVQGVGEVAASELPRVTARVPRAVAFSTSGAVSGKIGPAVSADLTLNGCGDLTLGPVEGLLKVAASGSGDLRSGPVGRVDMAQSGSGDMTVGAVAGDAEVSLAGSGDVQLGAVAQGLEVNIAGSGDVSAVSVAGPLDVSIAGSGDVDVGGGRPGPVSVSIAGSGGVNVNGPVGDVSASIMGSGDVSVGALEGKLERRIVGSGEVHVGD